MTNETRKRAPGAGRKRLSADATAVRRNITLRDKEQSDQLTALGGSKWVREQIEAAIGAAVHPSIIAIQLQHPSLYRALEASPLMSKEQYRQLATEHPHTAEAIEQMHNAVLMHAQKSAKLTGADFDKLLTP